METSPDISKVCKNCGSSFTLNFCNTCGQKDLHNQRLNFKALLTDFFATFLKFDKGLWLTLKTLVTNPGKLVRDYLAGKRVSYVNPMRFLLVTSAAIAFLNFLFGQDTETLQTIQELKFPFVSEKANDEFNEWLYFLLVKHNLIMHFLQVLTFPLVTIVFFRRAKLRFIEHLILAIYIIPIADLVILILALLLTPLGKIPFFVQLTIYLGYMGFGLMTFFKGIPMGNRIVRTALNMLVGTLGMVVLFWVLALVFPLSNLGL